MNIIQKAYQHVEPNLTIMCLMGLFGYPVYYYIWAYLFPQPYENLPLRIFCSALMIPIIFRNYLSSKISRLLPYYYLFVTSVGLPFFFSFMMIMNNWSSIWVMSFLTSILLHILFVYNAIILLIQAVASFILAYLISYFLRGNSLFLMIEWEYVPIILFAYVFDYIFYLRSQITYESKVSIAKSFGAGIAHEMRNPLGALSTSSDILKSLISSSSLNKTGLFISSDDLIIINQLLGDTDNILDSANETIDLILASIDQHKVPTDTFRKYSAQDVITSTLQSFSYRCEEDRESITTNLENDFYFLGNDTLLKYALYNLIKNAFYYQRNHHFSIKISIEKENNFNRIIVEDNGIGISKKQINNIFKDFYTHGKNDGFGLGLPFCRRIMRSFKGNIQCESEYGKWTRFILTFPDYNSLIIKKEKQNLLQSKSIALITDNMNESQTCCFLNYLSEQKINVATITLEESLHKKGYELEFSLIFINLDHIAQNWNKLLTLEKTLKFTKAQVCYLYRQPYQYPISIKQRPFIYFIDIAQFNYKDNIIEDIIFDDKKVPVSTITNPTEIKNHIDKKILIVDDNQSIRKLTALLLKNQGYNVFQAHDGKDALDIINIQEIDLILMDIEMPIMDGIETTKRIRQSSKSYCNIPILGHTGNTTDLAIQNIHNAGMNDYILKPSKKEHLLNKVANMI